MTVLDKIKAHVARNLEWWDEEPAKIAMYVSAILVSNGNTTERVDAQLITCKDCKHEHEEWGYPYCCRIPTKSFETDGDNFCGFAERRDA